MKACRNRIAGAALISLCMVLSPLPGGWLALAQPSAAAQAGANIAPPSLGPMLARVSPAIVNISVQGTKKTTLNPLLQDPFFRQFFGGGANPPPVERYQAVASGIIIDSAQGLLITNDHVVRDAQRIRVTLNDGRQFDATTVGSDDQTDVAVLKIKADRLTALPLTGHAPLQIGDYVVAIGNSFGVGQTATFGIVSAMGRSGLGIESYEDFIQTDASINPGNSGGALVSASGDLVGMNTAILSRSGGNVGIGFAIPVDMLDNVTRQLIAAGKVTRGSIGVAIQDLTSALAAAMHLAAADGVIVTDVTNNSAGAKAGIQVGDVIRALDGNPVKSGSQLRNLVGGKQPGAGVRLSLQRDGKEMELTVVLDPQLAPKPVTAQASAPDSGPLLGLSIGAIPQTDPNFGKITGVYVFEVAAAGRADEAGVEKGDIIVSVDRKPVAAAAQLNEAVKAHPAGTPLLLQIRRGDSGLFLAVP